MQLPTLLMYRRATLKIFNLLGINLGTSAIPNYQDFAAKVNLPFKNGGKFISLGFRR